MSSLKAINECIILRKLKKEEKTEAGILLPSSSGGHNTELREVISIGEKCSLEIKAGDIVICNEFSGNTFISEGESYITVCQPDILAVVEN